MPYVYVPNISLEPFDVGTNWSLTKTNWQTDNKNTQLCILGCESEKEAESIVAKMAAVIGDTAADSGYLGAMGPNAIASLNLLKFFFAAEVIPDRNNQAARVVSLSTNCIIHLPNFRFSANNDNQEDKNLIRQGVYFPFLLKSDGNALFWIDAGKFRDKEMVSLYGFNKVEEINSIINHIRYRAIKQNARLHSGTSWYGRKDITLVVSKAFLSDFFGEPKSVTHLQLSDENTERNHHIAQIFQRWEKALSSPIAPNHTNEGKELLNLPEFATIDDYVVAGGTLSSSASNPSSLQSCSLFSSYDNMEIDSEANVDKNTDIQADPTVNAWVRNVFK